MRTLPSPAGSAVVAIADAVRRPGELLEPPQLLALATAVAGAQADWRPLLRHDPDRRWYRRLYASPEVEVWLLAWSTGQDTLLHDHGGAGGAFHVVDGTLTEDYVEGSRPGAPVRRRRHRPGDGVAFGPAYVHNVADPGPDAATSVHAYSPALTTMRYYERTAGGELEATRTVAVDGPDGEAPAVPAPGDGARPARQSADALLVAARARLDRLTARDAAAAAARGALLVDIRTPAQRRAQGEIPGATVIERNVLEWRLDPAGAARIPGTAYDRDIVLVCHQGFASSLAAAALHDLGLTRATDLAGGFEAWAAAGLPVERG